MEPVIETPLQTGWPAMAALVALVVGLGLTGRRLLPERRLLLGLLAVAAAALVVRLGWVPALERHVFDGHEAEYWDIFRGERPLSRGGTILYPAMQWLWWSLGRVLPHDPRVPVVLMAGVGAGAAALVGAVVGRLAGLRAGLVAAAVVAVHPVHAAWSSSAYNVILPQALAGLALLGAAAVSAPRGDWPLRSRVGLGLVVGAAGALTLATRMEVGLLALPAVVLLLRPGGMPWRDRAGLLPGLLGGAVLAALALRPLLFPGEVPGAGERALAWSINVDLLDYLAPFHTLPALGLVLLGTVLALRRWPLPTIAFVGSAIATHLLMATFDDYGDRHALPALWGIAWALGAGAAAVPGQAKRLGPALALGGILVSASTLGELRRTYYAPDDAWLRSLDADPVLSELPRYGLDEVGTRVAPPGRCGWIAEDWRVAREPALSHFNLLDPTEAESLRGEDDCLRWCPDRQDWIWSSRGVRDRAVRVRHLYDVYPVGIVFDRETGFACVVHQVGARRR